MVVVESAPRGGRVSRGRRDSVDRYGEGDDLDANGRFDRERRRGQRREHRGEEPRERRRPTGGTRGRGRPREMESEFVVSAGARLAIADGPAGRVRHSDRARHGQAWVRRDPVDRPDRAGPSVARR